MTASATFMFDVDPGVIVYMGSGDYYDSILMENNTSNVLSTRTNEALSVERLVGLKRERIENERPELFTTHEIDMSDINTSDIRSFLSAAQLITPQRWYCEVKLVMHLDENKSIKKLEFLMLSKRDDGKNIIYN
jgi:hypothetical protein